MTMPSPSASNPDRRTVGERVTASFRLGADWQDNRHSVRGSSNQPMDPFEDHARVRVATFENAGIFAEATRQAGAKGRLVAGARVDWWTARDERRMITAGMRMGSGMPNPTAGLERKDTLPSGFIRYERDLG
jgi:iron complex outermembrane receptor protein